MGILGFTREKPTRDKEVSIREPEQRSSTSRSDKRDTNISVALTQVGREKAEQFSLVGPEYEIIATLLEEGTMSIGELASKTGFSVNKTRDICRALGPHGKNYIKIVKV